MISRTKYLLILIALFVFSACLAGCGGGDNSNAGDSKQAESGKFDQSKFDNARFH